MGLQPSAYAALDLLASAAALGQPHAQFEMGRRYEKGSGALP